MPTNNKTVSDSDTENAAMQAGATETGREQPAPRVKYEGITSFAYAGPSLPRGRLKSNTVLGGTYAQITDYYKEAIALYPGVARLIVPVAQLAEVREKTQASGNLMYNHYQEIAAAIKAKGEE